MILDIIFVIVVVLAIFKGYSRGLIVGVFSLIAVFIGLAAALKLSVVVARYIGENVNVSQQWLPIISFALVFIVVILLVRLGAKAIEKAFQVAMLGWLNRLGGIILYLLLYITVFSVLVFYAEMVGILKPETIQKSVTYNFVQPWGPKAIDALGTVIPWFRNMFEELQEFFGKTAEQI